MWDGRRRGMHELYMESPWSCADYRDLMSFRGQDVVYCIKSVVLSHQSVIIVIFLSRRTICISFPYYVSIGYQILMLQYLIVVAYSCVIIIVINVICPFINIDIRISIRWYYCWYYRIKERINSMLFNEGCFVKRNFNVLEMLKSIEVVI